MTASFRHSRGIVYDLKIEGAAQPIRVTGTHPFWSVDRECWVPVKDLREGQRLQGLNGTPSVESLTLGVEPEPVYNIEVEGDHCYRVGARGLLVHNMSQPNPGPTPTPGTIPHAEVGAVRTAWTQNSNDIGLGLYNPCTGEIHVGTFDTTGQRIGHDGLQMILRIPDADRPQWRGFVFTSGGQAMNMSGFNVPDGTVPRMRADYYAQVEDALRRAGLI